MCTLTHAQTLQHARQSRTLDIAQFSGLKPTMLASFVQAVVAGNAILLQGLPFSAFH